MINEQNTTLNHHRPGRKSRHTRVQRSVMNVTTYVAGVHSSKHDVFSSVFWPETWWQLLISFLKHAQDEHEWNRVPFASDTICGKHEEMNNDVHLRKTGPDLIWHGIAVQRMRSAHAPPSECHGNYNLTTFTTSWIALLTSWVTWLQPSNQGQQRRPIVHCSLKSLFLRTLVEFVSQIRKVFSWILRHFIEVRKIYNVVI